MPSLEPPIAHASSVEDVELTDEDEEVDITNTDPANPASIPEDGSIVGKLNGLMNSVFKEDLTSKVKIDKDHLRKNPECGYLPEKQDNPSGYIYPSHEDLSCRQW